MATNPVKDKETAPATIAQIAEMYQRMTPEKFQAMQLLATRLVLLAPDKDFGLVPIKNIGKDIIL